MRLRADAYIDKVYFRLNFAADRISAPVIPLWRNTYPQCAHFLWINTHFLLFAPVFLCAYAESYPLFPQTYPLKT